MLKLSNPVSVAFFSVSLIAASISPSSNNGNPDSTPFYKSRFLSDSATGVKHFTNEEAGLIYQEADLEKSGLSRQAFVCAYLGYLELLNHKKISNSEYLTI